MPSIELRQSVLAAARHVVVKLGTQLLSNEEGKLDDAPVRRMAGQICKLKQRGIEVTLVSSGAIGAGCGELDLETRPSDVAALQAVAAVGQRKLMTVMHQAFARASKNTLEVGQLLLTREDFDDRVRFLNIRNCIAQLHALNCIPVINENDTVGVEEIRFGDNDQLAALICNALRADALILLTVVDGLLDGEGKVIDLVESVTDSLAHAKQEKTKFGSGGMLTKLEAARLVTEAGELCVIANGREKNILPRLIDGEQLGTVFLPAKRRMDARQRWIGLTARPAGTIDVDEGAAQAVRERGKSLLASGVTTTTGQFARGDVVLIRDQRGLEVGRGLSNYTADELRLIRGKKSVEFEQLLGRKAYAEVVHRDNMVVGK